MSIFSRAWTRQLPVYWATYLRGCGHDCALCGARSDAALLCGACEAALPRITASCSGCALPLAVPGLCGRCLRHPPRAASSRAAFEYRFPVDRLVLRFKSGADFALGRWLAQSLAHAVRGEPRPDLLVAPPLTRSRLRARGFNPAGEIARHVGRELRVPFAARAVARTRETAPQRGLGRRERAANLRDVFRCRARVRGLHVAVVDDVVTTGATADAMARAILEEGAARVVVWSVARTPSPGS